MTDAGPLISRLDKLVDRIEQLLPEAAAGPVDWSAPAYRWISRPAGGALQAISRIAPISLDDLCHIAAQKSDLERNTRQFVAGLPANNALLWGPRGTGKSSLVRALLHRFAADGLRVVEVTTDALDDIHEICHQLSSRPERFVLFCDDLSFDGADPSYKALKAALDGSLQQLPDNVLIYATSNRRHLLPETMADNVDTTITEGELHYGDAVEEKISLSERFGLWVSFHSFRQEAYLDIVAHSLARLGVTDYPRDTVRREALRWALQHGSRSGRAAWQFARDYAGRTRLEPPPSDA
ncbi:MAG: ATP-binding protein [Gammaproteobacteria bacterium]|nr:ATP-binding protein [Gammaproteobacteria bacterium]